MKPAMRNKWLRKAPKTCPACRGQGSVCCHTWALALVNADQDLEFSGMGLPHWPLTNETEMNFCPFCGKKFVEMKG